VHVILTQLAYHRMKVKVHVCQNHAFFKNIIPLSPHLKCCIEIYLCLPFVLENRKSYFARQFIAIVDCLVMNGFNSLFFKRMKAGSDIYTQAWSSIIFYGRQLQQKIKESQKMKTILKKLPVIGAEGSTQGFYTLVTLHLDGNGFKILRIKRKWSKTTLF